MEPPAPKRAATATIIWDDEAAKHLRPRAADEVPPAKSPRRIFAAWRKERDGARCSVEGSETELLSLAEAVRGFFTDPGELDEADRVQVRIGRLGSPVTFGELDPVTRTELLRIAQG